MISRNKVSRNSEAKILILITARRGSIRLPRKHLLPLGGEPIILKTIKSVSRIVHEYDVIMSTDDPEIINMAKEHGIPTPFTRPQHLSESTTSIFDVIQHALDFQFEATLKQYDAVVLLQGSSPFRTLQNIRDGIKKFRESDADSLASVSPSGKHPYWFWKKEDNEIHPFFGFEKMALSKEDLPEAVLENGSVYIFKTQFIMNANPYGEKCIPIQFSELESTDIDTLEDYKLAELRLSSDA